MNTKKTIKKDKVIIKDDVISFVEFLNKQKGISTHMRNAYLSKFGKTKSMIEKDWMKLFQK